MNRHIPQRAADIQAALCHLRLARDILATAHAPRSADYVRRALKSAEGALRHAELEPFRLERQAPRV
jgi:hypothetical protein